jgi:hypothetical protein
MAPRLAAQKIGGERLLAIEPRQMRERGLAGLARPEDRDRRKLAREAPQGLGGEAGKYSLADYPRRR